MRKYAPLFVAGLLLSLSLVAEDTHKQDPHKKQNPPYLEDTPPPAAVPVSLREDQIGDLLTGDLSIYRAGAIDDDVDGKQLAETFLLRKTISSFGALLQDQKPQSNISYVFHLTLWNSKADLDKDNNPIATNITLIVSRFYAYRFYGGKFHMVSAVDKQIDIPNGGNNVMLLSLSVLRKMGAGIDAPQMEYDAKVKGKTAANVLALETLLAGVLGISPTKNTGGGNEPAEVVKPVLFDLAYQGETLMASGQALNPPYDVTYTATAKPAKKATPDSRPKLPPPASNEQHGGPFDSGSDGFQDAPAKNPPNGGSDQSGGKDNKPNQDNQKNAASSLKGCVNLSADSKCSFSQTISVENLQWWDVGIVAPFHGPRLNKYSLSTTDTVSQSHTILSGFVGTFDVSPWARYVPMDKLFYIQAGLPVTGSSFHLPYLGLAQPLPTSKWVSLSVFGGIAWMKQSFPKTLKIGQSTTSAALSGDLKTDWARKPMYGVELPITSIAKKLKSSLGGKSSSSSGGGS